MDEDTARDMDRLLAHGELSGPEADAIHERVRAQLEREQRQKRPRVIRSWAGAAGAALAAAAALLLVVGVPRGPGGPVEEEGTLAPKIEIRCAGGTLAACPMTGSLVFTLSGNRQKLWLSAWAEPVGREGKRIVYFEKEGGAVEIAAAGEGKQVVERVVGLSGVQGPWRYRVRAVVATRVLGSEELRRAGDQDGVLANVRAEVVIVE